MADAYVLERIQNFYGKILPRARCAPDWNEENVKNAFLWAEFCEQAHESFVNDSPAAALDEHMHRFPEKYGGAGYCFENLKDSSSVLTEAFFQNPSIERVFIENIISEIKPKDLLIAKASRDDESLGNLCCELLETLKFEDPVYFEVKAELFLKALKDVTAQLSTEQQSEIYMSIALETLNDSEETMMVLIHLLLYSKQEECKHSREIQEFAMNWVLLKVLEDRYSRLVRFIWEQPLTVLRALAVKYSPFSSYYIEFLTRHVASLELQYENSRRQWKRRESINGVTLSYQEVVNHFQELLSLEDALSRITRLHLEKLASDPSQTATVWQDICASLKSKPFFVM